MQKFVDLWRGIKTQPKKLGIHVFASFSMVFTVVKGITQFFPNSKIDGPVPLGIILFGCLVYGLFIVWKPSTTSFAVANCDTVIEIVFGDLFEQEGLRAIAINEFFDSQLGKPVSEKSVHGIFLMRCFGGHPEAFDAQLAIQLKDVKGIEVSKIEGKQVCYPVGTTALITANSDRYIVFVFAKTEPATCKAFSDVELMWRSLHALWQRVRAEANGFPVNLPLVGSGLSGLNLPTRDILNLIILSVITETKARQITQNIRVVLHQSRFKDVDLRDVKEHWKE